MIHKTLISIMIFCALVLLSSCDNSSVGPNLANITGTYAYKTIDSSGTTLDSGFLILTQIDSTLTGEIHTKTESATLQGQINYSGSLQFTVIPTKILSPFWSGVWESNTIQGYREVSTGAGPKPLSKQRFLAIYEGNY
jgi:hypothetical protein